MAKTKADYIAYINEYNKAHYKSYKIRLSTTKDENIIEWLETIPESFNGYVKRLILEDMHKHE